MLKNNRVEKLSKKQLDLPLWKVRKLLRQFPSGFRICPIHHLVYGVSIKKCQACQGDEDYAKGNVLDKIY